MIAAVNLSQMIAASRLDQTRGAIVDRFKALLQGISIEGHPGKLDINDVVAKAVVNAPGVMVGWTRVRRQTEIAGHASEIVDWAAYIVAEDYPDLATRRSTPRDAVAHGIGNAILAILADPDASAWGLVDIDRPLPDPGPQLVPMFTAKSWSEGAAFYAVTWSQTHWNVGPGFFDRGSVSVSEIGREEAGEHLPFQVDYDDEQVQTEIAAMLRAAEDAETVGEG